MEDYRNEGKLVKELRTSDDGSSTFIIYDGDSDTWPVSSITTEYTAKGDIFDSVFLGETEQLIPSKLEEPLFLRNGDLNIKRVKEELALL